ncbi:DUF6023 family protein [Nucisporomicrobium flavum]|uniref:DUF6023 family protein n=1 Tax=Nucisporomicrobium flavum TaxID=2785915 RepID=UPI0027DDD9F0|nr:DUF6023 family protein [Nucisporomicrobium flavum]
MTRERAQGVTLYALALLLALAGGFWFVGAAPDTAEADGIAAGRRTLEALLPDVPVQTEAETLVLDAGGHEERNAAVRSGSYAIALACVGEGQLRVRLSTTSDDSGRAVRCAREQPQTVEFTVALAEAFYMVVSAETREPSVFRWRLIRSGSY